MKLSTKTMNIVLLSLAITGASYCTFKRLYQSNSQSTPPLKKLKQGDTNSDDLIHQLIDSSSDAPIIPVAVIGSGPAGISAAMYTARAKMNTVVFTGHELGGELSQVKAIENLPGKQRMSGAEAMKDLYDQASHFGAIMLDEAIKSVDFSTWPFVLTTEDDRVFKALSIIIATGGVAKKLDMPGVEEYWGHGVGLCTICDAPFNKDQEVIVVGGDDTAAERALQLAAYAHKVTMLTKKSALDACETMQEYLGKNKNITILFNTELTAIRGNGESITHIECSNLAKNDPSFEIPAHAVYFSIGYKPSSAIFKKWLDTDDKGYIVLQGRSQKTSIPGIFAAGIIEDKEYGKAAVAQGNGVKAAIDAIRFLENKGLNAAAMQDLEKKFLNLNAEHHEEIPLVKNQEELDTYIQSTTHPLVVEFFSPQCPRCMHLAPVIKTLQAQMKDKLSFIKVDVTNAPELAQKFSIRGLPVFIIFNKGQELQRCKKITTREELRNCLHSWIV